VGIRYPGYRKKDIGLTRQFPVCYITHREFKPNKKERIKMNELLKRRWIVSPDEEKYTPGVYGEVFHKNRYIECPESNDIICSMRDLMGHKAIEQTAKAISMVPAMIQFLQDSTAPGGKDISARARELLNIIENAE